MDIAMLVLRLVPGVLFMGHGLQKLVPAKLSPPLLQAQGPQAIANGLRQMGLEPALVLALVAGAAEVGGGFLIASGLVTPLGTALLAAVMTVAILTVHLRKGIWAAAGGFEFPLLMLTSVFVVTALGPGRFSIDAWAGIANWTGIHWDVEEVVRAGAAVGAGVVAGLLVLGLALVSRLARGERGIPSPAH